MLNRFFAWLGCTTGQHNYITTMTVRRVPITNKESFHFSMKCKRCGEWASENHFVIEDMECDCNNRQFISFNASFMSYHKEQ